MIIKIGTRGSALALWQAKFVGSQIEANCPNTKVELSIIKTQGDKILDTPLAKIGTKGLFTKEIEEALLDNRVDLAVHSMKDLPTELPIGLKLAAVLERADPRDVFISGDSRKLAEILSGERIGTSSLRRRAFLLNKYPHLSIISIRGNVDTRIKKIKSEGLAGVILASAGVTRMGFADKITEYLDTDFVIPAIGQGAIAIETRVKDEKIDEITCKLHDSPTAQCILIERAFLRRMGGGCQVPMAAYCRFDGTGLKISAAVVHPDGLPILRKELVVKDPSPGTGSELADLLIAEGADKILKSVFSENWVPGSDLLESE